MNEQIKTNESLISKAKRNEMKLKQELEQLQVDWEYVRYFFLNRVICRDLYSLREVRRTMRRLMDNLRPRDDNSFYPDSWFSLGYNSFKKQRKNHMEEE